MLLLSRTATSPRADRRQVSRSGLLSLSDDGPVEWTPRIVRLSRISSEVVQERRATVSGLFVTTTPLKAPSRTPPADAVTCEDGKERRWPGGKSLATCKHAGRHRARSKGDRSRGSDRRLFPFQATRAKKRTEVDGRPEARGSGNNFPKSCPEAFCIPCSILRDVSTSQEGRRHKKEVKKRSWDLIWGPRICATPRVAKRSRHHFEISKVL